MDLMPGYPEKFKSINAFHQGQRDWESFKRSLLFMQHWKVCETNAWSLMTWWSYQPNYATQC